ncbi:rhodanese-like domain-containing protein [Streptomyces griseus]|uniref:rhodanese-like domain-containing protein n=1 Tax=Streptomyces griseus TaxID=1911 RepID=UPI0008401500|nr:rhodanese-like domain-containing protein [Streptomyces griseus]
MFFFRRGSGRGTSGRLTPHQAHRRTRSGEAVLLDVREISEWKAGHAPDAVHLPLSRLLTGAELPVGVAGRPVVAICRSGNRSQQAAKHLAAKGIEAVDVRGGMTAWTQAGLPVVGVGKGGSAA